MIEPAHWICLLAILALLAALAGCGERPSDAEVAAWRDEARAADQARKSDRRAAEEATWGLAISGAISGTISGVTSGVTSGATSGVTSSATSGVTSSAISGVTSGVTSSATSGVTSSAISGVTSSAISGVTSSAISGVTSSAISGVTSSAGSGATPGAVTSTSVVLEWKALQSLATEVVRTRTPHVPPYPDRPVAFRGVRLGALLERVGADPAAESLTLVCADGYRVEVPARDARQAAILLAIEADGKPIARNMGGPIYAVFPIEEDARIRAFYTHEKWAFYVAAIVVGTDARRVRVTSRGAGGGADKGSDASADKGSDASADKGSDASADKGSGTDADQGTRAGAGKGSGAAGAGVLDAAALDALPEVKIETKVGFRVGWPRDPLTLRGRRLRDVCAAAGLSLAPGDVVIVRGKAPVDRDSLSPHRIAAEDALASDILLVERSGATGTRVPASRGGPLLLGFPAELAGRYAPGAWVTFVEEIEVVRP